MSCSQYILKLSLSFPVLVAQRVIQSHVGSTVCTSATRRRWSRSQMLTFINKHLPCVTQSASSLQSAWKAGSPLAVLFTALAAWELLLCTHSSRPGLESHPKCWSRRKGERNAAHRVLSGHSERIARPVQHSTWDLWSNQKPQ